MLMSEYVKSTKGYARGCLSEVERRGHCVGHDNQLHYYSSVNDFCRHVEMQLQQNIESGYIEPDMTVEEAMGELGLQV